MPERLVAKESEQRDLGWVQRERNLLAGTASLALLGQVLLVPLQALPGKAGAGGGRTAKASSVEKASRARKTSGQELERRGESKVGAEVPRKQIRLLVVPCDRHALRKRTSRWSKRKSKLLFISYATREWNNSGIQGGAVPVQWRMGCSSTASSAAWLR